MTPRAFLLIRHRSAARFAAFHAGLSAAGFAVYEDWHGERPQPGDVLVIWNRVGGWAEAADTFEAAGATVLVAENGHVPIRGAAAVSLAIGGHNGAGSFPVGGPERWAGFGVTLAPWSSGGRHILVCGQRGIGSGAHAVPPGWLDDACARLRALTDRAVRRRPHPRSAEGAAMPPLAHDLRDCWCVVTWSSNAATEALLAGLPAIVCGPAHILAAVCNRHLEDAVEPVRRLREPAFERLAWSQWTLDEIASGEPFARLAGGCP